jgi:type I site-specific restriction-modification system R (restriction) subunit
MQKFETKDTYTCNPFASLDYQSVKSTKVLNFIDEAHHGQTQATAVQRSLIFPNASNYLFNATPKEGTYAYYFGDASRADHCDSFTISHAKACNITVPVYYLTAFELDCPSLRKPLCTSKTLKVPKVTFNAFKAFQTVRTTSFKGIDLEPTFQNF